MATLTETGMVERVARAIAKDWYENLETSRTQTKIDYISENWEMFEPMARRIVALMRNPTKEMYDGSDARRELWMSMIDKALKKPTRF